MVSANIKGVARIDGHSAWSGQNSANILIFKSCLQVSEDLSSKASAAELADLQLFRTGGLIGPCGRWHWSNGKLTRSGAVVWDKQCAVSDPEHFHHKQVGRMQHDCPYTLRQMVCICAHGFLRSCMISVVYHAVYTDLYECSVLYAVRGI